MTMDDETTEDAQYRENGQIVLTDGGPGTDYEDTPRNVVASDVNVVRYAQSVENSIENVTPRGEVEIDYDQLGKELAAKNLANHYRGNPDDETDRHRRLRTTEHNSGKSEMYELGLALGCRLDKATEDKPGQLDSHRIAGSIASAAGDHWELLGDNDTRDIIQRGIEDSSDYVDANDLGTTMDLLEPEEEVDNRVTRSGLEQVPDETVEAAKKLGAVATGAALSEIARRTLGK